MKAVSKEQLKKDLKIYFSSKAGLTIIKAKRLIKDQLKENEWNNSIKVDNIRLFFTDNVNYGGGAKNGFGKGFYLTSIGFTGGSEIKL